MQLFINNFSAALLGPIDATAVQLPIDPTHAALLTGLGSGDYYLLTLSVVDGGGVETAHEVVKVTAVTGGLLTVERAQEGAVAADWPAAASISARVTKGTMERLRDSSIQPEALADVMAQLSDFSQRIAALEAGGIP